MTRVVGIDPGTLSSDVCGMVDGRLYLDRSWPTADALADPAGFVELLTTSGMPDLIVGPSGYGLPVFYVPGVIHWTPSRRTASSIDNLLFVSPTEAPRRLGIDAGH